MKNPIIIVIAVIIVIISFLVYTETPLVMKGYLKAKNSLSSVIGPALQGINRSADAVGGIFSGYVNLVNAKKENQQLREKINSLRIENQRLSESERENKRFRELLGFMQKEPAKMVAATVVGEDIKNWYKCIIIDKGKKFGFREKMTVVTPKGLVGQIVEVHPLHSKIMVINDTNSSVDVYVDGKDTRGILEGTGQSTLRMKYVRKTDNAEIGDRLVTSGKDGIFPKGIEVGIITSVARGKAGIFAEIDVMPFNDFKRLEEVLVLNR